MSSIGNPFNRTFSSSSSDFQLDLGQIGHSHNAGKKMTTDLAANPVPDRACAHQIVFFTEPEPVLNLPVGKACSDDIARYQSILSAIMFFRASPASGLLARHSCERLATDCLALHKFRFVQLWRHMGMFAKSPIAF